MRQCAPKIRCQYSDYNYYGVKLAQLGYAAATIDYRPADQAPCPAAVNDSRNAIQWLQDHAKTYNIDTDRVALLGGSAGSHLVDFMPAKGLLGNMKTWPQYRSPAGCLLCFVKLHVRGRPLGASLGNLLNEPEYAYSRRRSGKPSAL